VFGLPSALELGCPNDQISAPTEAIAISAVFSFAAAP
jgi:hypothetical protein